LGTDGQTSSSVLEEARQLEMHERLAQRRRNVLAPTGGAVAATVLESATVRGARALDVAAGEIAVGRWADLVAFDLDDPHLAGWDDASLVADLMFSADTRAVRDVFVAGQRVVRDREHPLSEQSGRDFAAVARSLYESG
jgi:cytosine/adenosine deaminase-related metal-dependent hydrolase